MVSACLDILHVEDDATDAVIFKEALNKDNYSSNVYNITRVETMSDALKSMYNNHYSVILLDLNLPDLRGLDNVKCIRAENPELPIVVLTSLDSNKLADDVLNAGAQEYVVKGHCNGQVLNRIIHSSISRKHIENKLYQQAHYDELTGLPNKLFFRDVMKTTLTRAKRWDRQEAFLFVDIENFKSINQTFGEELGDCLLMDIAARIKENLRDSDFIARYRGNTFAIHLDKDNNENIKSRCMMVAEKVLNFMDAPFLIEDNTVKVSANVGISLYPEAGEDYNQIMENMEVAMHFLKVNEKTRYCFAKNLHQKLSIKADTKIAN